MEKVWLKNYQKGVAETIDPDAYPSINALLEESCQKYAPKRAFENMGKAISYADLEEMTRSFAAFLQKEFKIAKGDRVAVMMPNLLQYPIAMFGILRAGGIVVNVNPLFTADELEYQLNDSQAKAIVVLENFAHTLQKVVAKTKVEHIIVTKIGDMFNFPKSILVNLVIKHVKKMVPAWHFNDYTPFNEALDFGQELSYTNPELQGEDIAYLQYTGGTTGRSKGAILTHRNLVANLQQAAAWLKPLISMGDEIIITALPLYHIFSLTANCLAFMYFGSSNILITNPRDIGGFIKELSKHKFTAITGVNTLFNALLNNPNFASLDFSALKIALGGGMAVQHAVAERWEKTTGKPLLEAYGLTETSPAACINPMDLKGYNGKIGLPIPSTEVSIRNAEGEELSFGEMGELCIKGPQVMRGYWEQPEETANVLTEDGWLRTGDIATVDEEGFVQIVDRKKDMILVSGFNVYPNEVEDVIAELEGVQEVAVVGNPDEERGEIVVAFIVQKETGVTEEQIVSHCREHLTAYKVPKKIEFREELPKTNVGKILRRALK